MFEDALAGENSDLRAFSEDGRFPRSPDASGAPPQQFRRDPADRVLRVACGLRTAPGQPGHPADHHSPGAGSPRPGAASLRGPAAAAGSARRGRRLLPGRPRNGAGAGAEARFPDRPVRPRIPGRGGGGRSASPPGAGPDGRPLAMADRRSGGGSRRAGRRARARPRLGRPARRGLPWFAFDDLRRRITELLRKELRLPEEQASSPAGLGRFLDRARAYVVALPAPLPDLVRFRDERYPPASGKPWSGRPASSRP